MADAPSVWVIPLLTGWPRGRAPRDGVGIAAACPGPVPTAEGWAPVTARRNRSSQIHRAGCKGP